MTSLTTVLEYWFGKQQDDPQVIRQKGKLWFGKNPLVDAEIRDRFGALVQKTGQLDLALAATVTPSQRLAMIILLDQFPRNIYRDQPQAFAFDPLALELSLEGLEKNQDQSLRPVERAFFYLPLEHSELLENQDRSVALFRRLLDEVPKAWEEPFTGFYDYALRHQAIVAQFGRFPHRNKILGRISSAEEEEFLTRPNSSF